MWKYACILINYKIYIRDSFTNFLLYIQWCKIVITKPKWGRPCYKAQDNIFILTRLLCDIYTTRKLIIFEGYDLWKNKVQIFNIYLAFERSQNRSHQKPFQMIINLQELIYCEGYMLWIIVELFVDKKKP